MTTSPVTVNAALRAANPDLSLFDITDPAFARFGTRVNGYAFQSALDWLLTTAELPESGNRYVAGSPELETRAPKTEIEQRFYGDMPCQIGYCNGWNTGLNGLEFHKGSELLVAGTDLVLLLAGVQDMTDYQIHSNRVSGFYVPAGTAIELYATTLHFAPCRVNDAGFRSLIILPEGTNLPREQAPDGPLFARNKWLIIHPAATALKEQGAQVGISGPNLQVRY